MKYFSLIALLISAGLGISQKAKPTVTETPSLFDAGTVSALKFRSIGPALTSGRVADLAIHPDNKDVWYVAAASGGVWVTRNHGTTFSPIFDGYGSYSIGCVRIAPSNPKTIWVGTGENNNQRSVSYGDGVYKSVDGGKTFVNMGLKQSEHIGTIVIHPKNENILWVAAYGPLWSSGGERGVYKSVDGGKTWKRTLFVSENTGIAEVQIDPIHPDILYASAHQRRRHEWTYIGGGPESTVYKSVDGGESWQEVSSGLPKGDMGRVGLAVSPSDPTWVYAIVEARYDKGGVYLSTNRGETWNKQGNYSTSGNYYQEIFCDPLNKKKVFVMDTYMHHSEDAGLTFKPTGESHKHVDNHVIWIDPQNTDHWIVGCDGGIYETFSHAKEWRFYDNLPITQYYKVTTDNDYPFYNVFGGTQDNNSMGGPSSTTKVNGIMNLDWFITNGGDGFESATDWSNPNITYAQAQYGWLVRYDKKSGEKVPIQPMPAKGEPAYRWNWDAPLLVSRHDASTLYFAANRVFKSTNRGDDWQIVSPDLTKQMDRNKLPVMGQVWTIDAVMKNASTTVFGNIVALDESPVKKGLLYAGTDDGLIQVSTNEGKDWMKYETFPGVPAGTRVNMITASLFDENVLFACFNNQRQGDFKPYVLKSTDKGKTWVSVVGDLPERGTVYCIKQDFKDPNLWFVGTEFGAFFTNSEGKKWTKLAGLPTIAIYDLDIQQRECDLVAASFGRGFYVLDDYSPLRQLSKEVLDKKAYMFPTKEALLYIPSDPLGLEGTGFQGHNLWSADNRSFGAVFTLYQKEVGETKKSVRQEKEKALEKEKKDVFYPRLEELREENSQEQAKLIWSIHGVDGKEVSRFTTTPTKGISRIVWNLRSNPISSLSGGQNGFLVPEGTYQLAVVQWENGAIDTLIKNHRFAVKALKNQTLLAAQPESLQQFRNEVGETSRKVKAVSEMVGELDGQLSTLKEVLLNYPNADLSLLKNVKAMKAGLDTCKRILYGDDLLAKHEFEVPPSLRSRLDMVEYMLYDNTAGVSATHRSNLSMVKEEYNEVYNRVKILWVALMNLEDQLTSLNIPYTKFRGLKWKLD